MDFLFFLILNTFFFIYKGITSELPDLSVLQVAEAYKDFASAIATIVITSLIV